MRNMKRLILSLLLMVFMVTGLISCSELRSEFDPKKWRYKPYDTMPPSWENDMGRPGPGSTGDTW